MSSPWMSASDKTNVLLESILTEIQKSSSDKPKILLEGILQEVKKMNTNLQKMNELLAYKEWDWAPRSPTNTLNLSPRSHMPKKATGKLSGSDFTS